MSSLPNSMTILPPMKAIPLLLDRDVSPVTALDTEFSCDQPTCRADLRGLSLAGGKPGALFGTFFPFGSGQEDIPWAYLRDKVLWPLFTDPDRTMVLHPPKVDMQILRARGLTDEMCRCKIECTFSMAHIYDENLPKALKDLGYAVLGINDLLTHAQTVSRMKKLRKQGTTIAKKVIAQAWAVYSGREKAFREDIKSCWDVYRDERKRAEEGSVADVDSGWPWWRQLVMAFPPKLTKKAMVGLVMDCYEAPVDPSWPGWHRLALALPPKMLKRDVEDQLGPRIRRVIEDDYNTRADAEYARYGAIDALLTLGVRYFFVEGVPGVIGGICPEHLPLLELETRICHPIVTEMEERGLLIDTGLLGDIHGAMLTAIEELENELVRRWAPAMDDPSAWNPKSPEQVGDILWNRWGVRPPPWALRHGELKPQFRIKKTGLCSTNDDVLQHIVRKGGTHAEDVRLELEHRRLVKLEGTYVGPMLSEAQTAPDTRLHSSFWPVGARTGRFCVAAGTPVEILRDVGALPRGVRIEDVRAGDYAYTYDDRSPPRLTLRRVLRAGRTGIQRVVRIHWQGQGHKHHGHLDVTANHEVRLMSGEYVCAGALKPMDRILALSRGVNSRHGYARVWAANETEIAREHRWIYETLYGPVAASHHVHHRDENRLNNHPDNLEAKLGSVHLSEHSRKYWSDPENRRRQSLETKAQWERGEMTPAPSGPASPNYKHLTRDWLEAVLWKHGGKPTAFRDVYGLDYTCTMKKVREHGIDWRRIRFMHTPDGCFITRVMVEHARALPQYEAQRYVGKSYYGFRKLQEAYGLDPWNHIVERVETLPNVVPVYNIEVEGTRNFVAGELCVHNSSSDPNVENIPRPYTMPTIKIVGDAHKPPPGLVYEKGRGGKPAKWRVRSLRDVFVAPPGWLILSIDMSQIENRIIAHESQDVNMLRLFRRWDCFECKGSGESNIVLRSCPECGAPEGRRDNTDPEQPVVEGFAHGLDIHSRTAVITELFEKYGPEEGRQSSKPIMHGWSYGMGAQTLARREGMKVKDSEEYLAALDTAYPAVRGRLHPRMKKAVREDGYVTMFDGHVRRFFAASLLMRAGAFKHWEWEGVIREAVNVMAQGATGVIMKRAMWSIRQRILDTPRLANGVRPGEQNVYLGNQCHDELVYEVREDVAGEVKALVVYELEHAAPELSVPIAADGNCATTWGGAH